MTMQTKYDEMYLCFIDILGLTDAISNPGHQIYNRCPGYFLEAFMYMKEIMNKPDIFLQGSQVNQFSDGITISCPVTPANLSILIRKSIDLQQKLLVGGLATRGCIVKGHLYAQNGFIFGPALLEAVALEKKIKTPRIVLTPTVKADITLDVYRLSDDPDYTYVDFMKHWGISGDDINPILMLRSVIEVGLGNQNVRGKYIWLAKKYNTLIDELSGQYPALNGTKIVI